MWNVEGLRALCVWLFCVVLCLMATCAWARGRWSWHEDYPKLKRLTWLFIILNLAMLILYKVVS